MQLPFTSYRARDLALCVAALLATAIAGCGGNGKASVTGTVVADGKPVTEGTLIFAPVEGTTASPATGPIRPDGTFVLGTAAAADGAAIGRHQVLYNAPPPVGPQWDGYGTPPERKFSPFQGFSPKVKEVEVKAGSNKFTIELVPGR
jgi:hypothetical protein